MPNESSETPKAPLASLDKTINIPTMLAIVGVLVGQGFILPSLSREDPIEAARVQIKQEEAQREASERLERIEQKQDDLAQKLDGLITAFKDAR